MPTYSAKAEMERLTIAVSITPNVDYADSLELSELAQMSLAQAVKLCRQNNQLPDPEKAMPF